MPLQAQARRYGAGWCPGVEEDDEEAMRQGLQSAQQVFLECAAGQMTEPQIPSASDVTVNPAAADEAEEAQLVGADQSQSPQEGAVLLAAENQIPSASDATVNPAADDGAEPAPLEGAGALRPQATSQEQLMATAQLQEAGCGPQAVQGLAVNYGDGAF